MTNKIIFLVTLLSYSFIVSQPFMYMLSLKYTQLNLGANSYTEVRKLIDIAMRNNFKYVLYTGVFATLALVLSNIKAPGSITFITASIAFAALVAEILLTVKGSLPINDVINIWTPDNVPANWTHYRDEWFRIFQYRQWVSVAGFVSLLFGVVFGR